MGISWAVMQIRGCGRRSVELTFYLLPGVPKSGHDAPPLACGQHAESRGSRGVLLCPDCADLHGLKSGKPETNRSVLR